MKMKSFMKRDKCYKIVFEQEKIASIVKPEEKEDMEEREIKALHLCS